MHFCLLLKATSPVRPSSETLQLAREPICQSRRRGLKYYKILLPRFQSLWWRQREFLLGLDDWPRSACKPRIITTTAATRLLHLLLASETRRGKPRSQRTAIFQPRLQGKCFINSKLSNRTDYRIIEEQVNRVIIVPELESHYTNSPFRNRELAKRVVWMTDCR